MKAIKITAENTAAIAAALLAVNGKALNHVYSTFNEIAEIAVRAEARLALILSKKELSGAKVIARSGGVVPNAYKYSRRTTLVTIERRSSGWFLIDLKAVDAYKEAGKTIDVLTVDQDSQAVARFRKTYTVTKPVEVAQ